MQLMDYERLHGRFVRKNAGECTVLLKKDGHFPLSSARQLALYGNGARRTIKGGTGSGEVNSRYTVTIERGLKKAGFEITSEAWLKAYDAARKASDARFVKDLKAQIRREHLNPFMGAMGKTAPEPEYDFPLDGAGDTAIYVLSRISGEGSDRQPVEGDILLSATEIRDILACDQHYQNFMLVINAGGVVDLSPVMGVRNILVLSQLGSETGRVLADLLLGRQNPSGKLTTTWAAWGDYATFGDFGNLNETRYKEGIYVGYRYFDSFGRKPLFPFGFGLSYTSFEISDTRAVLDGTLVTVHATVRNTGEYAGKEVVQVYVSIPSIRLDEPYQVLAGFVKTALLKSGESQQLDVVFSMKDLAPYDEDSASYLLENGDYLIRVGNSSRSTQICAAVRLPLTVTVRKVKNILGSPDFDDYTAPITHMEAPEGTPILMMHPEDIRERVITYDRPEVIASEAEALSDDALIKMNLGAFNPGNGFASMIGNAGFTVAGAAGQSMMELQEQGIPSMVMADGPAGLRLSREYAKDTEGGVHGLGPALPESMVTFFPSPVKMILKMSAYRPKKSDVIQNQFATSLPIGTAIAQSFNTVLAEEFGRIVGDEMEFFGVHLWLAPALNIHRSIQCGRNFEYYSEDPLVSGLFAAAVTRGVQSFEHAGTTIKHFAFNNQEYNRTLNNSQVSERAAREIYLKGFEICVRDAQPKAVMTSYNLVNGRHTSEHAGLIEEILRSEFDFQGIVMTDWVVSGMGTDPEAVHETAEADRVVMAGGDLFMPGSKHDYNRIRQGLEDGTVTRRQLAINATRVMNMAKALVKSTDE